MVQEITQQERDVKYLKMAFEIARDKGTDPSTQNGAVIVDCSWPYEEYPFIVGKGANHFPKGVKETKERWERPLKYAFVEHAERNAIYDAAKNSCSGVAVAKTTMYCPWYACADCARAIIQSGIKEVVGHQRCFDLTPNHWKDSIAHAFVMFEEAGIVTRKISDEMGVTIRFNGQETSF